jgi:hypothetical protein
MTFPNFQNRHLHDVDKPYHLQTIILDDDNNVVPIGIKCNYFDLLEL